jgi:thioredoxin reductase
MDHEVVIIGGSVAGLSAALVLGRSGRNTLVCDDGHPRNAVSRGVHGFLTRDGLPPAEFLRIAREQVLNYTTVAFRAVHVTDADRIAGGFAVRLADGTEVTARKLLLATGLIDELPVIEGLRDFWGKSAFMCPFCDAWEVRGQRLVVFGRAADVYDFATEMLQWSQNLVVCTDGPAPFDDEKRQRLNRLGIELCEKRVARMEGRDRQIERVRFTDGTAVTCRALFLTTCQRQRSSLAEKLGCPPTRDGTVPVDDLQHTGKRGVYVAGNAAEGLQSAILAAAEGFKAAYAINEELLDEFIRDRCGSPPAGSA